jgi:hypothetical protein
VLLFLTLHEADRFDGAINGNLVIDSINNVAANVRKATDLSISGMNQLEHEINSPDKIFLLRNLQKQFF